MCSAILRNMTEIQGMELVVDWEDYVDVKLKWTFIFNWVAYLKAKLAIILDQIYWLNKGLLS